MADRPIVSKVADELYLRLLPLAFDDEELGWPLLHYCEAVSFKLQEVNDYARDTDALVDPVDFALDRSAVAQSITAPNVATQANDGDGSTFWQSGNVDEAWWEVDLGESTWIYEVQIDWGTNFSKSYIIENAEASGGAGVWCRAALVDGIEQQDTIRTELEAPARARYWRVRSFERNSGASGVQINEASVYGGELTEVPGWSVVLDANRVPLQALGWLAQFVGVTLSPRRTTETDPIYAERMRRLIRARIGWDRGTLPAFIAAAQQYMTGSRAVAFRERDGNAYKVTVRTPIADTPDPDLVEAALLAQKPAGIVLDYATTTGREYDADIDLVFADYNAVLVAYETYDQMLTGA